MPQAVVAVPELTLLDWKREVIGLYARVRDLPGHHGWLEWRRARDRLFAEHQQSPVPAPARSVFEELSYFPYDPGARCIGTVRDAEPAVREIASSTGEVIRFRRFATVVFELWSTAQELPLYWLEGYGGGVFLPFADATNRRQTYGGGRYLLDTVKGADLGGNAGEIVLDFNFAYNPSCAYDPRWSCPLPPAESVIDAPVTAGERVR
jgi:uncharacterized protein (DUF1684 family)